MQYNNLCNIITWSTQCLYWSRLWLGEWAASKWVSERDRELGEGGETGVCRLHFRLSYMNHGCYIIHLYINKKIINLVWLNLPVQLKSS